jgi:hypothetical protein
LLLLTLRLLVARCLVLACFPPAPHGADYRPDSGSLPGIARNCPDGGSTDCATRSTPRTLATAGRRTGLLGHRLARHGRWIHPRRILRPHVALTFVAILLRGALSPRGIDYRLLGRGGDCNEQRCGAERARKIMSPAGTEAMHAYHVGLYYGLASQSTRGARAAQLDLRPMKNRKPGHPF